MTKAALQALNSASAASTVTLKDVRAACKAQAEYSAADRARRTAEDEKKATAMRVFEALLGVKSEDEVRAMSPQELQRLARRRIRQGLVTLEGVDAKELLEKVIQKSKSERRPSWKDCFIHVLGESAAADVQKATEESFSYRFVDSAL